MSNLTRRSKADIAESGIRDIIDALYEADPKLKTAVLHMKAYKESDR